MQSRPTSALKTAGLLLAVALVSSVTRDLLLADKTPEKPAQRELTVSARYLLLPVKNRAPKRRMRLLVDGKIVREFEIELADQQADFEAFSDLSAFKGKKLTIAVDHLPAASKGLSAIHQEDSLPAARETYHEKRRPQFHFTSRRGWLNDPNGLVWCAGEYHLFYQHNPYGWDWGNMHWGHAVSKDLVHWRELPIALYPHHFGDWAFSGSAVVDKDNTSGWQKGEASLLVAAFTSTGRGECIVYSNDKGRTWNEYEGNPVVKHAGRDPRLLWHPGRKCWILAVYDEHAGKRWIAFYSSNHLKNWTFESRIEGFYECPDLYELPVEGEPGQTRWVLSAADGKYLLGQFDGHSFRKESGKHQLWHGNFYAAQTFSNTPDGRRIQIGWSQGIAFPGMPFNQQMGLPCQLTLRKTEDGLRLFANPVRELESLRSRKENWKERTIKPGEKLLSALSGRRFEIVADVDIKDAARINFEIGGVPVLFDAKKQVLTCKQTTAPLAARDGKIRLRFFLDHGSLEVFGNEGRVALSVGIASEGDAPAFVLSTQDGSMQVRSLEVFQLKSAWAKATDSESVP